MRSAKALRDVADGNARGAFWLELRQSLAEKTDMNEIQEALSKNQYHQDLIRVAV
jgi:hypothetical protein